MPSCVYVCLYGKITTFDFGHCLHSPRTLGRKDLAMGLLRKTLALDVGCCQVCNFRFLLHLRHGIFPSTACNGHSRSICRLYPHFLLLKTPCYVSSLSHFYPMDEINFFIRFFYFTVFQILIYITYWNFYFRDMRRAEHCEQAAKNSPSHRARQQWYWCSVVSVSVLPDLGRLGASTLFELCCCCCCCYATLPTNTPSGPSLATAETNGTALRSPSSARYIFLALTHRQGQEAECVHVYCGHHDI